MKRRLARLIRLNAVRKGLLGGSRAWRIVWVALLVRRMVGRDEKVVYSGELGPGQTLVITRGRPAP